MKSNKKIGLFLFTTLALAGGNLFAEELTEVKKTEGTTNDHNNFMHTATAKVPNEVQDDAREAIVNVIKSAARGDINEFIRWTTKEDQKRMNTDMNETSKDLFDVASKHFRTSWSDTYSSSFEDTLEDLHVPIRFTTYNEKAHTLDVIVGNGPASLSLQLINEGVLGDAWRVNVPDTTSKESIINKLQAALQESLTNLGSDKNDAISTAAVKILAPLSSVATLG